MVIRSIITCGRFCLALLPLLWAAGGGAQAQQFQQRFVGDSCPISESNTIGECKLYKDCPEAFMGGRLPDLCSYVQSDAVICCPSTRSAGAARPPTSPPPVATDLRPVGSGVLTNSFGGPRPSQIKCDEYSKLAVNTFSVSPLVLDPEVFQYETPNCDFTTPLIVDGEKAKTGEFPHMAAIGWQTSEGGQKVEFNCGGMLISDEYVLTAGHCTSYRGVAPTTVRLGDQNLVSDSDNADPKDFQIAQIIPHPEYSRRLNYNDIALLRLSPKVTFNKLIRPACLWQTKHINVTQAVATGWGNTDFAYDKSDELLKVSLYHYPLEECSPFFERNRKLPNGIIETQICFGNRGSRKDTCQGDSGGPLQVVTPGNICTFHLIALTSFGKSCGIVDSPGVYTRISSYLDWIEPIVWPNL